MYKAEQTKFGNYFNLNQVGSPKVTCQTKKFRTSRWSFWWPDLDKEQPERALYPAVGQPVTGGGVGVQYESVGLGSGQRSRWSLLWWEWAYLRGWTISGEVWFGSHHCRARLLQPILWGEGLDYIFYIPLWIWNQWVTWCLHTKRQFRVPAFLVTLGGVPIRGLQCELQCSHRQLQWHLVCQGETAWMVFCYWTLMLMDFLFATIRPAPTHAPKKASEHQHQVWMDEYASMQGGAVESGSKPAQLQTSSYLLNLPDTGTDAVVIASVWIQLVQYEDHCQRLTSHHDWDWCCCLGNFRRLGLTWFLHPWGAANENAEVSWHGITIMWLCCSPVIG